MQRGVIILAGLMIVLIGGAGLTANLAGEAPTIIQSTDPNASVFTATPEQAAQFIFWIMFVLGNVVVVAGILAVLLWRTHHAVANAKEAPIVGERPERTFEVREALPEPTAESA